MAETVALNHAPQNVIDAAANQAQQEMTDNVEMGFSGVGGGMMRAEPDEGSIMRRVDDAGSVMGLRH